MQIEPLLVDIARSGLHFILAVTIVTSQMTATDIELIYNCVSESVRHLATYFM